jgi:hypothetical protein
MQKKYFIFILLQISCMFSNWHCWADGFELSTSHWVAIYATVINIDEGFLMATEIDFTVWLIFKLLLYKSPKACWIFVFINM